MQSGNGADNRLAKRMIIDRTAFSAIGPMAGAGGNGFGRASSIRAGMRSPFLSSCPTIANEAANNYDPLLSTGRPSLRGSD
jgi:hypothetical protein